MNDERRQNGGSWENEEGCDPTLDDGGDNAAGYEVDSGNVYPEPGDCEPGDHEPGDEGPLPSWERRDQIGFFNAFFLSFKEILFEPEETFRRQLYKRGAWNSLAFLSIVGTLSAWFGILLAIMFKSVLHSKMEVTSFSWLPVPINPELFEPFQVIVLEAILAPIFVILCAVAMAALLHLSLIITRGERNGFEATFRVVCYTYGATMLFSIMPVYGSIVGLIWYFACICMAVREAHQTDTWRAFLAVCIQPLICLFCVCALPMVFSPLRLIVGAS